MPLPDRLILHPPPGAGSLLLGEHPLGAGRVNALLAHNGRYLALANACRPLASHPGWRSLYAAATRGAGYTGAPAAGDIRWQRASDQYANACLGTFYVWPEAWLYSLPRLVLRYRVAVTSPHTCGVCLAVVPGTGGPLSASRSGGATHTSATFADGSITLEITREDVQPQDRTVLPGDGTGTADEQGQPLVFTVYAGAYCSSGTNGQGADLLGLTLGLESSQ